MSSNNAILRQIPYTEEGRLSSLIIQGRPGIGKSHILHSIVPKRSPLVRIPMATRNPDTFGAYPLPVRDNVVIDQRDELGNLVLDQSGEKIKVDKEVFRVEEALSEASITPLLERNIGDGYGVLLLDDITLGHTDLQGAVLEVVQFGMIAGEKLGRNVLIILTGNTVLDGSYASEWSAALLGRCMLVNLEPDCDTWVDLDTNRDLEPVVIGFLKDHPKFFAPQVGDEDTTDESGKTPSPRDWTRLGLAFKKFGGYRNFEPSILLNSLTAYATSFVGSKAGIAFTQYAQNFEVYPTGEELYNAESSWTSVPRDKRELLSGSIAVIFALRNHAIKLIGNDLHNADECFKIIQTMLDRTRLVGQENKEVVAYMTKYFLTWATDDEYSKERENVIAATCDVLNSPEYSEDKEFKDFLNTMWRIKNN
jgi:hypothetical protein